MMHLLDIYRRINIPAPTRGIHILTPQTVYFMYCQEECGRYDLRKESEITSPILCLVVQCNHNDPYKRATEDQRHRRRLHGDGQETLGKMLFEYKGGAAPGDGTRQDDRASHRASKGTHFADTQLSLVLRYVSLIG